MGGIFDAAVAFYGELEADNSKEFWARERHRYDGSVKPVFAAVLDDVDSFGAWRIYRPHNDTRFGKSAPYKAFAGAVAERADGVGAFVQVSAAGVLVGTGLPMPAADQLPRLRAAIAADGAGEELLDAIRASEAAGARVFGGRYPPLARMPRGYPADHPRSEQLRWKGVEADVRVREPGWQTVPEASAAVTDLLRSAEPLHAWLARHVGPSALTPEERFAPRRRSR